MPPAQRYFAKADRIEFRVSEPDNPLLARWLDRKDYGSIAQLLTTIGNRCIRSLRNQGHVHHVHELTYVQEPEKRLFALRAEVSDGAGEWQKIIIPPAGDIILWALTTSLQPTTDNNVNALNWPNIEEAIQDDLVPGTEDEFYVNAVEHLRLKNLRLAVLESIIGLEIVLTRYLKEYLRVRTNTPKDRIQKFVTPQMGLTARLSGILDLTLTKDTLNKIELHKILKVVEWRNSVIHRTGHLPSRLPDSTVEDGVSEVLALTRLLATRAYQLTASPQAQVISAYLTHTHNIPAPSIWFYPDHRIVAEFRIFSPPLAKFPDSDKLNALVSDFISKRKEQDVRFDPEKHLFISFFEFPDRLRARWRDGNLEVLEDEDTNPSG